MSRFEKNGIYTGAFLSIFGLYIFLV